MKKDKKRNKKNQKKKNIQGKNIQKKKNIQGKDIGGKNIGGKNIGGEKDLNNNKELLIFKNKEEKEITKFHKIQFILWILSLSLILVSGEIMKGYFYYGIGIITISFIINLFTLFINDVKEKEFKMIDLKFLLINTFVLMGLIQGFENLNSIGTQNSLIALIPLIIPFLISEKNNKDYFGFKENFFYLGSYILSFLSILYLTNNIGYLNIEQGLIASLLFSFLIMLQNSLSKGLAMGEGDILLVIPLGFIIGYFLGGIYGFYALLISSGIRTIYFIPSLFRKYILKKFEDMEVPFGPFLITGSIVTLTFGEKIIGFIV